MYREPEHTRSGAYGIGEDPLPGVLRGEGTGSQAMPPSSFSPLETPTSGHDERAKRAAGPIARGRRLQHGIRYGRT